MKEITTIEILAIRLLGSLQKHYGFNLSECQINWAITQMLQGAHSLSLFALAGMKPLDNPFEVNDYFLKVLKDLKIEIPAKHDAVENYVIFICKRLVAESLSEQVGCELIANICFDLQYQAYTDWYDLIDKLDSGLITYAEFKTMVKERAHTYLNDAKKGER